MSGEHKFWSTQPVPQQDSELESPDAVGPLETDTEVKQTPYALPQGFEWSEVDISDEAQLDELYKFLNMNYVEDSDCMFRFDYSKPFLRWGLNPPGSRMVWHLGVRASNGKLYGFISAIPAKITAGNTITDMVEINFLCVHKKLRERRLAPMLIREITRRCNVEGIFQAAYTAGVEVPTPIGKCRYYHRNLNPVKLIECGFTSLRDRQTLSRVVKIYKLPADTQTPNLVPLSRSDVPQACALLNDYLQQFSLHPVFSPEDFAHWFIPQTDVVTTYVVKDPANGTVTDILSFYTLPSTVINNPKHSTLKVAYSFYNVAKTVTLEALMRDGLILANKQKHDVFNALNLMENGTVLEDLKFGKGDGDLHYYLFNFKTPKMDPSQVGLVLL